MVKQSLAINGKDEMLYRLISRKRGFTIAIFFSFIILIHHYTRLYFLDSYLTNSIMYRFVNSFASLFSGELFCLISICIALRLKLSRMNMDIEYYTINKEKISLFNRFTPLITLLSFASIYADRVLLVLTNGLRDTLLLDSKLLRFLLRYTDSLLNSMEYLQIICMEAFRSLGLFSFKLVFFSSLLSLVLNKKREGSLATFLMGGLMYYFISHEIDMHSSVVNIVHTGALGINDIRYLFFEGGAAFAFALTTLTTHFVLNTCGTKKEYL